MEVVQDLYRAGAQPGPSVPLRAPGAWHWGHLGGTGALVLRSPRAGVSPWLSCTGALFLGASTCVLKFRTMSGTYHVIYRPTFLVLSPIICDRAV
jgi:hypothetical protein